MSLGKTGLPEFHRRLFSFRFVTFRTSSGLVDLGDYDVVIGYVGSQLKLHCYY